ncbi:hypothetical protein YC2023_043822 [Brassica napus]
MSSSQELSYKAGEATGQVQVHTTQKDIFRRILCIPTQTLESYRLFIKNGKVIRYQDHSGRIMHFRMLIITLSCSHTQNNPSLISQASNVIQQTGGQVKNMAQGTADTVKNSLGMSPATNNPSSPAGTTRPSNPSSRNI